MKRSKYQDPLKRHRVSAPEMTRLLAAERAGDTVLAYRDDGGTLELFVVPAEDSF